MQLKLLKKSSGLMKIVYNNRTMDVLQMVDGKMLFEPNRKIRFDLMQALQI